MIGAVRTKYSELPSNAGNTGAAILILKSRKAHGKDKKTGSCFRLCWTAVVIRDGQRSRSNSKEELKMLSKIDSTFCWISRKS